MSLGGWFRPGRVADLGDVGELGFADGVAEGAVGRALGLLAEDAGDLVDGVDVFLGEILEGVGEGEDVGGRGGLRLGGGAQDQVVGEGLKLLVAIEEVLLNASILVFIEAHCLRGRFFFLFASSHLTAISY